MTGSVLAIRGLTVRYASGPAVLDGVELSLRSGECLALVGESGCGKTTLARAILGLLPGNATVTGTIELLGTDISQAAAKTRRALLGRHLGYVAQDPYAACDPIRSVRHHLAGAWRAHGETADPGVIDERISTLGIGAAATRLRDRPHQWSGGMLQRASISAATVHDPELVLADEPTSALDAELADGVLRAVRQASRSLLLISHDLRLVENHADRIAVLRDGRIVETGRTSDVTTAPRHEYSPQLLTAADSIRSAPRPSAGPPRPPATPPVVTIERASVSYRSGSTVVPALRDASLTVHAGEIVGIAGPSGSGKSTLLRIASGTEVPGSGTVTFADGQATAPRGYVMPVFQDLTGPAPPARPAFRRAVPAGRHCPGADRPSGPRRRRRADRQPRRHHRGRDRRPAPAYPRVRGDDRPGQSRRSAAVSRGRPDRPGSRRPHHAGRAARRRGGGRRRGRMTPRREHRGPAGMTATR